MDLDLPLMPAPSSGPAIAPVGREPKFDEADLAAVAYGSANAYFPGSRPARARAVMSSRTRTEEPDQRLRLAHHMCSTHDLRRVIDDADHHPFRRHARPGDVTHGCCPLMLWPMQTGHRPTLREEQPPNCPGETPVASCRSASPGLCSGTAPPQPGEPDLECVMYNEYIAF